MSFDLPAMYREYLARFERELPGVEVGAFTKHKYKLIKKLDRAEFEAAFGDYHVLVTQYQAGQDNGDTINDAVVRHLSDKAAALLLPLPT